jgi:hypothetical protein
MKEINKEIFAGIKEYLGKKYDATLGRDAVKRYSQMLSRMKDSVENDVEERGMMDVIQHIVCIYKDCVRDNDRKQAQAAVKKACRTGKALFGNVLIEKTKGREPGTNVWKTAYSLSINGDRFLCAPACYYLYSALVSCRNSKKPKKLYRE